MEQEELLSKAYIRALSFIAHKPRTVAEVRKKLADYLDKSIIENDKIKTELSDKVIDLLSEEKYLDDARYISEYIDIKTASGKKSLRTLKTFLIRKGIDPKVAQASLSKVEPEYELSSAVDLGRKKVISLKTKEANHFILKRKLYTYLLGKGYQSETVERAVDTLLGVK